MKKKLFVILSVIFTIAELVILSLYYSYNIFGVKQNFDSFKILFFSIVLIFIQSFFSKFLVIIKTQEKISHKDIYFSHYNISHTPSNQHISLTIKLIYLTL